MSVDRNDTETGHKNPRESSLTTAVLKNNPIATFACVILVIAAGVFMIIGNGDQKGFVALGVFLIIGGIYLTVNFFVSTASKRRELARIEEMKKTRKNTKPLRYAEKNTKCKVLAEAKKNGYHICYRRVRSVNELVINGRVYDEKKGIFEMAHSLSAYLDGHLIEVGYDIYSYCYVAFDDITLAYKKRYY